MSQFFDIKSIILAFVLVFIGFMYWPTLFYILPIVAIALFVFGIIKASRSDSPGSAALYLMTLKYLALPSSVSVLYILFTHVQFV